MSSTIHRSARRFDALFADGPPFLALLSIDGCLERIGARALEPLGFTPDEVVGQAFEEALWWRDLPDARQRVRRAVTRAGREPRRVCVPLAGRKGVQRTFSLSISRVGGDAPEAFVLVAGEDVTRERCRHERDAARHRALAERLEEERHRLIAVLATLAHEMRNPLAPIRHGLELLGQAIGTEEREELRAMMTRQVTHVARLVEDLFDLARLDEGQLTLHEDTVEADELVRDALEQNRPLTEARHQAVTTALPAPAVLLHVDPSRMAQVLSNLLSNAARYTPEDGRIDVRVTIDGEHVRFSVADDGRGLDAASCERIFEMFTQLPGEDGNSPDGLGVGLTLARRFVELHGGTLEVESAGLGQGSTFTVSLPLARLVAVAPTPEPEPPSGATAADDSASRRVLLVVDDNRDAADVLARLLDRKGFDVVVDYTGLAALERAAEQPFDAIVLDIGLPDINGHEVAERLRARGDRTRLVALTGWGTAEDVARSLAAGFDEHLTKPVTARRLLEALGETADVERPPHGDESPTDPGT